MQAHPSFTLTMIGLAWLAGYLLACAIWPFAACWRCKGGGRFFQDGRRKSWRMCPRCKGTGARRRVGRTIWAYFAGARKRAK